MRVIILSVIVFLLLVGSAYASTVFTYGQRPIGSIDRAVYQQPMVMQLSNGTVATVMVSVMVWRN